MPHRQRNRTVCASILAALLASAPLAAQAADDAAALKLGKEVFSALAEPHCAICHTLADAEAVGEVGPNLDDLKPDAAKVRRAVEDGVGAMPPYEGLSEEQVAAVAAYVSGVAGAQ